MIAVGRAEDEYVPDGRRELWYVDPYLARSDRLRFHVGTGVEIARLISCLPAARVELQNVSDRVGLLGLAGE